MTMVQLINRDDSPYKEVEIYPYYKAPDVVFVRRGLPMAGDEVFVNTNPDWRDREGQQVYRRASVGRSIG